MRFSRRSAAAALSAAALPSLALAQTSTDCNPLTATCPNDTGLNKASFASDFTSGAQASWSLAEGTTLSYSSDGALFSIKAAGQAPTISTDFYFLFGRVDVTMRASAGTGIISSIVLLSDDLDEIDWEFIGGNSTTVETNFFGKGNTTLYDRAIYYPVDDPQDNVHTYSIVWTSEQLEWIIDGATVRTLPYDDPLTNGGEDYPQTPMRLRLGNWAAGGPGEPAGTVTWAGGSTNFADAPFNMYVESVAITNYNPATAYEWEGNTGSWQDIKIINSGSTASATGSGSAPTGSVTNTVAPTSSVSVNTKHTGVTVPVTKTGSSYTTTTTGSSSAAAAASSSAGSASSSTVSSAASVPASTSAAASSSIGSVSSAATASSSTATATPTVNAAVSNAAVGAGSLLSVLLAAMML